jgi:hypothetical protein
MQTMLMKNIFPLLFLATLFAACGGGKNIYNDKNITDKKLEKLIRDYSADPGNTDLANQVKFAYDYLHNQHLSSVNQYQYASSLQDKENLLNAYIGLQSFYNKVRGYSSLNQLLKPGTVGAEIESTKLALVSGHYEQAVEWLDEQNWKTARQAYRSLTKVQGWMPDYKDTRALLKEAKELSVIHAVVLPLRADGIYYNNNQYNSGPRLSEQLVRDLGGSYNAGGWYKVYNTWEATRAKNQANWSIEPVWTQLRTDDPRQQQGTRQVEKQTEIGKDTSGRAIYKKLVATLTITEVTYSATGRLEIRINDEANDEKIATNGWYETYSFKKRWATYKGDAGALSNDDWELINASRNTQVNESVMEEKLLEKIYPNLLSYIRSYLNN